MERFSDTQTRFYAHDRDPQSPLHRLDRAHLGIAEFARHYPQIWEEARGYAFYMLWRPPHARLLSSVNEYSRRFAATDIRFVTTAERRAFLFETLSMLESYGAAENILDRFELTHFRPQWIYAALPDVQIDVTRIPLAEVDRLYAAIGTRVGQPDLQPAAPANPSEQIVLPGRLARFAANSGLRTLVTRFPAVSKITPLIRKALLARQPQQSSQGAFGLSHEDHAEIERFVQHFYRRDLEELCAPSSGT